MNPHISAATRKITRPVGKPLNVASLRNHPPSALSRGQLTDIDLVNMAAAPFAMFIDAIDTMNGGTDQYATRYPLNSPNIRPTAMQSRSEAPIGIP